MGTRQLNTRVDVEQDQRLERLAERTGRSKSFYVAEFIDRGLNDFEDYYLAKDKLQEFYDSEASSVPLSEVDWDAVDG